MFDFFWDWLFHLLPGKAQWALIAMMFLFLAAVVGAYFIFYR